MNSINAKNAKAIYALDWKALLKDVVRFYAYLFLFYALALFLTWAHGAWVLESHTIDMSYLLSSAPMPAPKEFSPDHFQFILAHMIKYASIPAGFCAFFARPPKPFKHIIAALCAIAFIGHVPFLYDDIKEWMFDVSILCASVLTAWAVSSSWYRRRGLPHSE